MGLIPLIGINLVDFEFSRAIAQLTTNNARQQLLIEVKKIELVGNTVFSEEELRSIITPFLETKVSIERLLELRSEITNYYVEHGYISSAAFIPPQEFTNGIVTIQIIEGTLEVIEIEGLSYLKESYISLRLPPLGKPLQIDSLNESLAQLREDPLIDELKATLSQRGTRQNILKLEIGENKPFKTQFSLNNSYSPSISTLGGSANANYHLLGLGDMVNFEHTRTEGLTRYKGGYSLPVNKYGGKIGFNYTNANSEIVEAPISLLDIQADFEAYQISLRQPIVLSKASELAMGIEIELIQSETFVRDDFSFAFVDGLPDGQSQITALRLAQEYFHRGSKSSIAVRSQFNIGLDLFDSTVTEIGRDGLFWSWQGQAQWLQKLDNLLLVSSLNLQLTDDKLLPIEQFSLGGFNSVRGYRRNLSIGDNGVTANVELQIPLFDGQIGAIKLIPFVDGGTIWNNSAAVIESDTLFSTGLGLSYELANTFEARIDYAIPLVETEVPEDFSAEERVIFHLLLRP